MSSPAGASGSCEVKIYETNSVASSLGPLIQSKVYPGVSIAAGRSLYTFDGLSAPLVSGKYYLVSPVCTVGQGQFLNVLYHGGQLAALAYVEAQQFATGYIGVLDGTPAVNRVDGLMTTFPIGFELVVEYVPVGKYSPSEQRRSRTVLSSCVSDSRLARTRNRPKHKHTFDT